MSMKRVALIAATLAIASAGSSSASKAPNPNVDIVDYEITGSDFVSYYAAPPLGPVTLDFQAIFDPFIGKCSKYGCSGKDGSVDITYFSLPLDGADLYLLFPRAPYRVDGSLELNAYPVQYTGYPVFSVGFSPATTPQTAALIVGNTPGVSVATNVSFSSQVLQTAVPEPDAWVMMLIGFGAIGSMLRRARLGRSLIS
jgi:hypothetical protein